MVIIIRFEDESQTPTGDGNELGGRGAAAEDPDVRGTDLTVVWGGCGDLAVK